MQLFLHQNAVFFSYKQFKIRHIINSGWFSDVTKYYDLFYTNGQDWLLQLHLLPFASHWFKTGKKYF
jgi:hypothetical protein